MPTYMKGDKLKIRKHNFQIGVFVDIIKEYGTDALDTEQVYAVAKWVQDEMFPRG